MTEELILKMTWGEWFAAAAPAITAVATTLYVVFTFIVIRQNVRTQRRIEVVQRDDARFRVLDRSPIIEPSDSVRFRRKRKNVQEPYEETLIFPIANPTQYPATDVRIYARVDGRTLEAKDGTDAHLRIPANLPPRDNRTATFYPGSSIMMNVHNGTYDLGIELHWTGPLGIGLYRSATYRGTGETKTAAAIVGVGPLEMRMPLKLADMGFPETDLLGY